jgi:ankyrin repeat protein
MPKSPPSLKTLPNVLLSSIVEYGGLDARVSLLKANKDIHRIVYQPSQWVKKHFPKKYAALQIQKLEPQSAITSPLTTNYKQVWEAAVEKHYMPLPVRERRLISFFRERDFPAILELRKKVRLDEVVSLSDDSGEEIVPEKSLAHYKKVIEPYSESSIYSTIDQAAQKNYWEIVEFLVQYICINLFPNAWFPVSKINKTLVLAAEKNQLKIIELVMGVVCIEAISANDADKQDLEGYVEFLFNALRAALQFGHLELSINLVSYIYQISVSDSPLDLAEWNEMINLFCLLAVRYNHIEIVKYFHEEFTFPFNLLDEERVTYLMLAAEFSGIELVSYITSKLSIPDLNVVSTNGRSAILIAAENKKWDIVNYLMQQAGINLLTLKNNNDDDGTYSGLLDYAIMDGRVDFVESLYKEIYADQGCPAKDAECFLYLAATQDHWHIVTYLLSQSKLTIPPLSSKIIMLLHLADLTGHGDLIKKHYSSQEEDIQRLISEGTTLFYAVQKGELNSLKKLVRDHKFWAIPCLPGGSSLLHFAVEVGRLAEVDYLCFVYGDVDRLNEHGQTAMHLAARAGVSDIVQCLHQRGADLNARTPTGTTPLYFAVHSRNKYLVEYLCKQPTINHLAKTQNGIMPWMIDLNVMSNTCLVLLAQPDVTFHLLDRYKQLGDLFNNLQKKALDMSLMYRGTAKPRFLTNLIDMKKWKQKKLTISEALVINMIIQQCEIKSSPSQIGDLINKVLNHSAFSSIFFHGFFCKLLRDIRQEDALLACPPPVVAHYF